MLNNINSDSGLTPSTYSFEEKIAPEELQTNTSEANVSNDTIDQPEISEKVIDELVSQYVHNETLLSQKIFENNERLTLSNAESLIFDLIQNKTIKFLSALDVIRIDVMNIMQQLSFDRKINAFSESVVIKIKGEMVTEKIEGKEILHSLSVEICCLLRTLHDYCPLLNGELSLKVNHSQLIESQKKYLEVFNIYIKLEAIVKDSGSYETKTLCWKLKKYCDVLYYLSHNSNFLKNNLKSLSSQSSLCESVLSNPIDKSHLELYINSLSSNLFSMMKFKTEIDLLSEKLKKNMSSLKQCCNAVFLDDLTSAIQETIQITDLIVSAQLKRRQKVVIETGINSSLKNCFEILRPGGDVPFLNVLKELIPLVVKASDSWELYKKDEVEISDEFEKQHLSISKRLQNAITNLEGKIKKDKKIDKKNRLLIGKLLTSISEFPQNFLKAYNSILIASCRLPSNIMQEIRLYFLILDKWNIKAEAFHKSLYGSTPPCTFFNPIDLVILQIFRCQDKLREFNDPLVD
jgi:hypothetical protein